MVPLSQMARNERLNNGTGALSTRNKNYVRDDDGGNDKSRNELSPEIYILFPAATFRGLAVKLSMKSLRFENILNPEVD